MAWGQDLMVQKDAEAISSNKWPAMLTRIIKEFEKTRIFTKYNILISDNEDLYEDWKNKEMDGFNIRIVNEKREVEGQVLQ